MKSKRSISAVTSVLAVLLFAATVLVSIGGPAASASAAQEPLYMFNVVGDMQMGYDGCYDEENYELALKEIKSVSPETKAIVTVGDNTNNSTEAAYKKLRDIKASVFPDVPMYLAIGNHDRGYVSGNGPANTSDRTWADRFVANAKEFSGNDSINKVYYSVQLEGSYFIFLGSEVSSRNDNCNDVFVSDDQYDWFKAQMEEASKTGKPIFVVIHEPFPNTISGSLPGQGWQGNAAAPDYYPDNRYEDLKGVADQYPQALVFSGHTHWEFASKSPAKITDGKKTASYFNCSAVGYLWNDNNAGFMDKNGKYTGSEGWFVYVYEDKVVLKGRDFVNQKWIIEETVPLKAAGGNSSGSASVSESNSNTTTWIIIGVCAAAVVAVVIAVVVVVSSKKKKESGNEK